MIKFWDDVDKLSQKYLINYQDEQYKNDIKFQEV